MGGKNYIYFLAGWTRIGEINTPETLLKCQYFMDHLQPSFLAVCPHPSASALPAVTHQHLSLELRPQASGGWGGTLGPTGW